MAAYCRVMAAVRQPTVPGGATHNTERRTQIASALVVAADVPLQVAAWAVHALHDATALLPVAAKSGVGDAGAGALLLLATAKTALQNVRINTRGKESPRACATARRANELSALLGWLEAEVYKHLPG
jgi:formiminotetrahydrofolate cyclodeaminase